MNAGRRRVVSGGHKSVLVLVVVGASIAGCGHAVRPYDAARLERECGFEGGRELTRDELHCLATVAGLRATKKCPFEVTEGTVGDPATPVWFVRESCGAIGIAVTRTGAIVRVEVGDATAPPGPD